MDCADLTICPCALSIKIVGNTCTPNLMAQAFPACVSKSSRTGTKCSLTKSAILGSVHTSRSMSRHGGHHEAQKSTSIGRPDVILCCFADLSTLSLRHAICPGGGSNPIFCASVWSQGQMATRITHAVNKLMINSDWRGKLLYRVAACFINTAAGDISFLIIGIQLAIQWDAVPVFRRHD